MTQSVGSKFELLDAEDDVGIKKERTGCVKCLCNNLFMITIIIGVLIGFAIGFGLRELEYLPEDLKIWISMPGDLYIRLLKLTILPLIASNVIVVIAKLDPKVNGKISLVALIYIVIANIIGASVGAACTALIGPGLLNYSPDNSTIEETVKSPTTSDVFADLFLNIFPDNIIGIALFQSVTSYHLDDNGTEVRTVDLGSGTNMIGVIFVSVTFGLAASAAKERGEAFLNFFASLAEVVLKLIRAFLKITPVGVAFMIAGAIVNVDDIASTFTKVGIFIGTVVAAIAILTCITWLIFFIITRKNPFKLISPMMNAWFISFATTSAIVSIPEMYAGCDTYGIRQSVSRFVAPLAATLKSDGSACFIASACIFIAQLENGATETGSAVIMWLLASALAIAIPHIPSSSIVIIITVLTSVGVPVDKVSLLYAVEWLLDRVRSGFSTVSTFYCIAVTDSLTREPETDEELGSSTSGYSNE